MRGHVDAESLALYAEGELSRGRTARVRAHLSGCAECTQTAASLAEVSTELSQVPVPPLPAAVAARLDAALSAESARRAAPEPAPAPAPPPRRSPRWSPGALRILTATAVTLVVAGGVGYALSQSSGPATSGASAPAGGTQKPTHRSVQAGPLVSPGGRIVKPNTNSSSGPAYARTGTNYHRGTLAPQAQRQLAQYTVPGMSGPGQVAATRIPAQFRACATRLADGRPLLLVDLARYQRQPAIVIVVGPPDKAIAASYSCVPLHSARLIGPG
jgi:Putative zinc-finger